MNKLKNTLSGRGRHFIFPGLIAVGVAVLFVGMLVTSRGGSPNSIEATPTEVTLQHGGKMNQRIRLEAHGQVSTPKMSELRRTSGCDNLVTIVTPSLGFGGRGSTQRDIYTKGSLTGSCKFRYTGRVTETLPDGNVFSTVEQTDWINVTVEPNPNPPADPESKSLTADKTSLTLDRHASTNNYILLTARGGNRLLQDVVASTQGCDGNISASVISVDRGKSSVYISVVGDWAGSCRLKFTGTVDGTIVETQVITVTAEPVVADDAPAADDQPDSTEEKTSTPVRKSLTPSKTFVRLQHGRKSKDVLDVAATGGELRIRADFIETDTCDSLVNFTQYSVPVSPEHLFTVTAKPNKLGNCSFRIYGYIDGVKVRTQEIRVNVRSSPTIEPVTINGHDGDYISIQIEPSPEPYPVLRELASGGGTITGIVVKDNTPGNLGSCDSLVDISVKNLSNSKATFQISPLSGKKGHCVFQFVISIGDIQLESPRVQVVVAEPGLENYPKAIGVDPNNVSLKHGSEEKSTVRLVLWYGNSDVDLERVFKSSACNDLVRVKAYNKSDGTVDLFTKPGQTGSCDLYFIGYFGDGDRVESETISITVK